MLSIAIPVLAVAGEFLVVDISDEVDSADVSNRDVLIVTEVVTLFVLDCGFVAIVVDLSISIFKKSDIIQLQYFQSTISSIFFANIKFTYLLL